MEKILALIAVSFGKKATVYAIGRVSLCQVLKMRRWVGQRVGFKTALHFFQRKTDFKRENFLQKDALFSNLIKKYVFIPNNSCLMTTFHATAQCSIFLEEKNLRSAISTCTFVSTFV